MFKIHAILCPVDFSDASRKAVQYAKEFALSMGSSVSLLNVVEPRPMAVDITLNYIPFEEDLQHAANEDMQRVLEEFQLAGLKAESSIEIGNPSDVILDKARELNVNLIILGSHGKTGLSRLLMGSVAEMVVRKAPCPVLIVKAEETEFIGDE